MVGGGMFNGLGTALIVGLISFICIIIIGIYGICNYAYINFYGQTFESKKILKPDYSLESNGKNIDTTYIYKIVK